MHGADGKSFDFCDIPVLQMWRSHNILANREDKQHAVAMSLCVTRTSSTQAFHKDPFKNRYRTTSRLHVMFYYPTDMLTTDTVVMYTQPYRASPLMRPRRQRLDESQQIAAGPNQNLGQVAGFWSAAEARSNQRHPGTVDERCGR